MTSSSLRYSARSSASNSSCSGSEAGSEAVVGGEGGASVVAEADGMLDAVFPGTFGIKLSMLLGISVSRACDAVFPFRIAGAFFTGGAAFTTELSLADTIEAVFDDLLRLRLLLFSTRGGNSSKSSASSADGTAATSVFGLTVRAFLAVLTVETGAFAVVVPRFGRNFVVVRASSGASSLSDVGVESGIRVTLGVIVEAALFGIRLRVVERSRVSLAGTAMVVVVRLAFVRVVLDVGLGNPYRQP